jgi:hypothetical protein
MRSILIAIMVVSLGACSLLPTKTQTVVIKGVGSLQKAIVTGCTDAPVMEVTLNMIVQSLPPGTTVEKLKAGVAAAEKDIETLCGIVKSAGTPATVITQ